MSTKIPASDYRLLTTDFRLLTSDLRLLTSIFSSLSLMNILIRPWSLADLPAVRHITWTTWLDAYSSFIPEHDLKSYLDVHYSLSALEELFKTPTVKGFIATIDGVAAGYAKTKFDAGENRLYVTSIYILPDHQGHGLGGKLLRAAEECAKGYNVDVVWLGVMTKNIVALNWYKKIGFQFVEEAPFTMGGTTVNHVIGWKKTGRSE